MKITKVRTAVIDGNFPWVLVRVETDAGATGLGEAYWGAGVAALVHRAGSLIIGEDPVNIGKLMFLMERCLSGEGAQAGATVTAMSGIEIALWDLVGRIYEAPISTFFGGRFRSHVRVYADCHAGETHDPDSYAEKARAVVAEGYTALKFDLDNPNPHTFDVSDDPHPRRQWVEPYSRAIGAAELRWMVDMVRAVRAAVGLDATLAMDCHWKFNVNDAIRLARALEPFDLAWLEDPTPPLNMAAQREVARATKTPICTGENLYRLEGFRELIDSQAARIVAPDIPKMGGLMEFKKVADLAAASYIPMAPHNVSSPVATVAAAEVCAAIPNFLVLEYHAHEVDWWADLVDGEPPIRDGHVRLNSRPGHGLTLNEDVARAHLRKGHSYFGETP